MRPSLCARSCPTKMIGSHPRWRRSRDSLLPQNPSPQGAFLSQHREATQGGVFVGADNDPARELLENTGARGGLRNQIQPLGFRSFEVHVVGKRWIPVKTKCGFTPAASKGFRAVSAARISKLSSWPRSSQTFYQGKACRNQDSRAAGKQTRKCRHSGSGGCCREVLRKLSRNASDFPTSVLMSVKVRKVWLWINSTADLNRAGLSASDGAWMT